MRMLKEKKAVEGKSCNSNAQESKEQASSFSTTLHSSMFMRWRL